MTLRLILLCLAVSAFWGNCRAEKYVDDLGVKAMLLGKDISAKDLKDLVNRKVSFYGHIHAGKQGPQVSLNKEVYLYLKPADKDKILERSIYDKIDSLGDQKVLIVGVLRFHAKEQYTGPLVDGEVPVGLPGDFYYCVISNEEDITLAKK